VRIGRVKLKVDIDGPKCDLSQGFSDGAARVFVGVRVRIRWKAMTAFQNVLKEKMQDHE
jgi:hypothetical protein